jgi:hypothetical protein
MDSYDRQRRGLTIRKMYQTIAPWTTQNPIFMHLVSKNDAEVFSAIDQCKETGYEALILSFGSHLEMENNSKVNLERWKKLADYAHQRNILIGGYSLFSSRKISEEDDVIDPKTGKTGGAFFGYGLSRRYIGGGQQSRNGLGTLGGLSRGFRRRLTVHHGIGAGGFFMMAVDSVKHRFRHNATGHIQNHGHQNGGENFIALKAFHASGSLYGCGRCYGGHSSAFGIMFKERIQMRTFQKPITPTPIFDPDGHRII